MKSLFPTVCLLLSVATKQVISFSLHHRPTRWTKHSMKTGSRVFLSAQNDQSSSNDDVVDVDSPCICSEKRRKLLFSPFAAAAAAAAFSTPNSAWASGLMQFPCTRPLQNRYHFMRAGTSLLEQDHIYSTNPLFLTNRAENSMSEESIPRILAACEEMIASGHVPTVTYHSLAANSMDTGDVIATYLKLGRDRLLPEFTYLDQRGIGLWDSSDERIVRPAIWAMDAYEAGRDGVGVRPPPKEDGTPNESLGDHFVRLRQFLSLQESRTTGENILIIFPDGTGPALLSCMIAGIPFNEVHCLEYQPGEIRLDITRESTLNLYNIKKNDPEYLAILEDGKEKLASLRKSGLSQDDYVSLKDQMAEEQRLQVEQQFAAKKAKEQQQEQERKQQQQQQQQAEQKRMESEAALAAAVTRDDMQVDDSSVMVQTGLLGMASIGAAAAGWVALGGSSTSRDYDTTKSSAVQLDEERMTVVGTNGTIALMPVPSSGRSSHSHGIQDTAVLYASQQQQVIKPLTSKSGGNNGNASQTQDSEERQTAPKANKNPQISENDDRKVETNEQGLSNAKAHFQKEMNQLTAASKAMDQTLVATSLYPSKVVVDHDKDAVGVLQGKSFTNTIDFLDDDLYYEDGGANAWLQTLVEIRDEQDE